MKKQDLTLALTLGDPGGIGPEIILKALYQHRWPDRVRFVIIGSRTVVARQARQLNLPMPNMARAFPASARLPAPKADPHLPNVILWEPAPADAHAQGRPYRTIPCPWTPGQTGRTQGLAAAQWIRAAVDGCLAGRFAGMVTAPICKKSLSLAGLPFPGHTEYLAHLTETDEFAMMLMSKSLRVILATRHLALKQVPGALTAQALTTAITLSAQALKWLKVKNPTVGVCALNPHAGDQGLLGNEEIRIIRPTVHRLQRQGLPVEGPIPGDVIFYHALRGRYGAVVALYHDQGLGPLKMLDFDTGINLTLGLPILRVSPDHGTAFDIAGQNTANPASLIVAIQTALRLAQCPNPWMRNER